ncbi:MAG TPA: ATP-binding protein [Verrucomicrobiae bacterium]|nr:ATP-binding protein [Verrucomicrobiae bacterium]
MSAIRATIGFLGTLILCLPAIAADESTTTNPISPLRIVAGQPITQNQQYHPAEAEGTVTFVGRHGPAAYLEIGSAYGPVPVTVSELDRSIADLLLDSRIRVQGACVAVRNSVAGEIVGSLRVTNADDINIMQIPERTWQRYPLSSVGNSTTNLPGRIVHLKGVVRAVQQGYSLLLSDDTGQVTVDSSASDAKLAGVTLEILGQWTPGRSGKFFQSVYFRIAIGRAGQTSLPTLTTTEQVRWLNPGEAARRYPVKVRAVVTFLLGSKQDAAGNLQDGTGGIYAWHLVPSSPRATLRAGDFCEIDGYTSPGEFSPGIECRRLRILGHGEFPEPDRPTWNELTSGGLDAQWVELEGIVLSTTNQHMEIRLQGGDISCFVPDETDLQLFSNAVVRVRGVVVADWDLSRHVTGLHLNLPSEEFISLETPVSDNSFSLQTKQIKDLLFYDPGESQFRREKIAGQIIGDRLNVYYLTDGTNGLRLVPKDNLKLSPGDTVEAVGFPEIDSSTVPPLLTLREAVVRITGKKSMPAPLNVTSGDLLNSEYDSTLVRLDALIVHAEVYGSSQVLELEAGVRTVFARLNLAAGRFPQLPPGSLVEVTGVYAMNDSHAQTGPFELLLNSPEDLKVLELPSWWTRQHTIMVVTGMAAVILFGLIWITLLRQQVGRRTAQLSTANRSLEAEITERKRTENELVQTRLQHLVEQERTRIARDIHDELGSNLSQIRLLSEMALSQKDSPSETSISAEKISAKALEATNVLDEIVWAVDPQNDTLESLLNYFANFASDFLSLANIRFRIDAPTKIPPHALTAQIRHQLYMAFKETLTNIANHARATEVWIRVSLENDVAGFIIEDNGRGFDLSHGAGESPSPNGLNNMRKRFDEIGGTYTFESTPGKGTRVKFVLPLNNGATA